MHALIDAVKREWASCAVALRRLLQLQALRVSISISCELLELDACCSCLGVAIAANLHRATPPHNLLCF
jgi:hypothetical protein